MDSTTAALCALWGRLLQVHVRPDDDFFESGGHSMLIIEMVAEANALGLDIAPEQVLDYPTPALLADALRESA